MRHAGPLLAIEALQQKPLVVAHRAPIPPLLAGGVQHGGGFARAVRVAVLDADDGVGGHGGRVGDGEGEGFQRAVERAPDVDDAHARLEQFAGFRREVVPYAGEAR